MPVSELKDIKSLTLNELTNEMNALGLPAYRAEQIFKWLHEKAVQSFDEMLNIPKNIRKSLTELYYISVATIEKKQISCYDGTIKYLFRLNDGEFIESVLMDYHHGHTICISTQVGCKMGCTFCATGKSGFSRNLTPSEMLAQIQSAQKDNNIRISNIVLMGMGEPLDNFDNVIKFLSLVSSNKGINIGMRHITLSTCGVVPKMYELAKLKLQITLSVSLHAPNDEIRSRTMPINNKYNVNELIKACRDYVKITNRRITFEYAMIDGVNDSDECAEELAHLVKGMLCHINLIPVNSVNGTAYQKSKKKRLVEFSNILEKNGVTATIRRTLGSDIDASCGQLRRKKLED
ncbi:MAG: 23S rRNA (adenine(2503)-C(2))-methyltransferase RlmN [Acutalibacteraceae bacterium]|nr:23S rRNA (adenine(2503)-C(2))-methyltransferase RlmN [Acutalibacteraceae bacterium]